MFSDTKKKCFLDQFFFLARTFLLVSRKKLLLEEKNLAARKEKISQ